MYGYFYRNIKHNKMIYNFCLPLYSKVRYYMIKYFYFYTLKKDFKNHLGYELDLENPKTFNEKLQWLKVHYRNPIMPACADKVEVRKIVSKEIGEEYLIPIYGVWDNVQDIKLDKLPNQFVLKSSHASGQVIITKNKNKMDFPNEIKKMKKWLKTNYYYSSGEWIYKDIKPRIICEQLLEQENNEDLRDYRVFCFNGKAKFIAVDFNITDKKNTRRNLYDLNWKLINAKISYPQETSYIVKKPDKFEELIYLSEKLASDFPHTRVDFYIVKEKLFFGEITFFHQGGMGKISPADFEMKSGSWIELREK